MLEKLINALLGRDEGPKKKPVAKKKPVEIGRASCRERV